MHDLKYDLQKKIIYLLIILTPIIDTLNGLIIYYQKNIPLGGAYRSVFLVILFILFIKNSGFSKHLLSFYFIFFYLFINPIITSSINNGLEGLSVDFEFASRIVLFFITIFSLGKLIKYDFTLIRKSIDVSCWILPVTVIIPFIFRIGNNTYVDQMGKSVGFKGFYYSNNALNVVMLTLFIFCLDDVFKGKINFIKVSKFFLVFLTTIIIGSKSSLIFSGIMLVIYILLNLKGLKIIHIVGIFIGGVIGAFYLKNFLSDIIEMQLYRFANNNIVTYLLSGRNDLLKTGWDIYFDKISINSLFFGLGNYEMITRIGMSMFGNSFLIKGIEMDLFDLFFNMGLITLIIFLYLFIKIIYISIKLLILNNKDARPFIFSLGALICFSFLGGHVITEALSITFFGVITAGIISIYRKLFEVNVDYLAD